jgi:hypothetical protein
MLLRLLASRYKMKFKRFNPFFLIKIFQRTKIKTLKLAMLSSYKNGSFNSLNYVTAK